MSGGSACAGHPRSRGERLGAASSRRAASESSPLARGKAGGPPRHQSGHRGIPTPSEKGATSQSRGQRQPGHPRLRGEKSGRSARRTWHGGSSPLSRRKVADPAQPAQTSRVIPARAENVARSRRSLCSRSSHPRVGGERVTAFSGSSSACGSSPVRAENGKMAAFHPPAFAGHPLRAEKDDRRAAALTRKPGHPRSRGERYKVALPEEYVDGASPLARRKAVGLAGLADCARVISARAEKGCGSAWCLWHPAGHPRAGGERLASYLIMPMDDGLSPLARRKARRRDREPSRDRVIPAHAEKGSPEVRPARSRPGHPRSRGERRFGIRFWWISIGSSPRVNPARAENGFRPWLCPISRAGHPRKRGK